MPQLHVEHNWEENAYCIKIIAYDKMDMYTGYTNQQTNIEYNIDLKIWSQIGIETISQICE